MNNTLNYLEKVNFSEISMNQLAVGLAGTLEKDELELGTLEDGTAVKNYQQLSWALVKESGMTANGLLSKLKSKYNDKPNKEIKSVKKITDLGDKTDMEIAKNAELTINERVRFLYGKKYSVKVISEILGVKNQRVRNVIKPRKKK